jgi:rubrerythrin
MKEMTKANLSAAFAGESQAHMKYLAFADIAEREGFANVARLFRAVSFAEQMHATAHLRALSGTGPTTANRGFQVCDGGARAAERTQVRGRVHLFGERRGAEQARDIRESFAFGNIGECQVFHVRLTLAGERGR